MSAGHHHHKHNLSPAELDDLLAEALANPKIKARLARPYKLLTSFDIALLGSSSIGGAHVYFDRHLPAARLPVGRRNVNVIPGLIRHERLEQALEDILGWPYAKLAHPVAQAWEEQLYQAKNFNPREVEKAFAPYIKRDEIERIEKTPTDLDMRPLLALQEGKVIARVNATAEKEKRTHASVGYVDKSTKPNQRCGKCRMFIAPVYGGPGCTGVKSEIQASGWCRRFKLGRLDGLVAVRRASGGRVGRQEGGGLSGEPAPGLDPGDLAAFRDQGPPAAIHAHDPRWDTARNQVDALTALGQGGIYGLAKQQGYEGHPAAEGLYNALQNPSVNAALGVMSAGPKGPIKAYHGSPHDFEKFDISKIGTGEGAQAYGHGLYFAENPGVAREYKEALGSDAIKIGDSVFTPQEGTPESMAASWLHDAVARQSSSPYAFAYQGLLRLEKHASDDVRPRVLAAQKILGDWQEKGAEPIKQGRMYEVALNADPEHFLDWDKPLSQQHPKVQEFIRNRAASIGPEEVGPRRSGKHILQSLVESDAPGGELYNRLSYKPGAFPEIGVPQHDVAAQMLREAGIPGIKYLDQGSRGLTGRLPYREGLPEGWSYYTGPSGVGIKDARGLIHTDAHPSEAAAHKHLFGEKGTSNYAVFDDKLIDILKKYGIAGLLGGAGAMSQRSQQ